MTEGEWVEWMEANGKKILTAGPSDGEVDIEKIVQAFAQELEGL